MPREACSSTTYKFSRVSTSIGISIINLINIDDYYDPCGTIFFKGQHRSSQMEPAGQRKRLMAMEEKSINKNIQISLSRYPSYMGTLTTTHSPQA